MVTLGGTDLGTVQKESHTKDSGLFHYPLPRSNSSSALLADLLGVSRVINIEGIYTGTQAEIRTFISTIEGYCAGVQSGKTFVSSLITSPSSFNVFIQTFTWSYEAGSVEKIFYNLVLLEGVSITS